MCFAEESYFDTYRTYLEIDLQAIIHNGAGAVHHANCRDAASFALSPKGYCNGNYSVHRFYGDWKASFRCPLGHGYHWRHFAQHGTCAAVRCD